MAQRMEGNIYWDGFFEPRAFRAPPGSIGNTAIPNGADIAESKLEGRHKLVYAVPPGEEIVNFTVDLAEILGATGTVKSIRARVTGTAATGNDRSVEIDLQKAAAGSASYTSILSAAIEFTDADNAGTSKPGTVSNVNLVAGDVLRLVGTVEGSDGDQAEGLLVTVTISEKAN